MDLDTSFDAMLQHARIALGSETRSRHQRRRDSAPRGHTADDTTVMVSDLLRTDDVDAWVQGNAATRAPVGEPHGKPHPGRTHLISPSVSALLPLGSNTLAVRSRSPETVSRCTTDELFRHVALVEKEHQVRSGGGRVAFQHDQAAADIDPTTELCGPLPGDRVNTFRNHSDTSTATRPSDRMLPKAELAPTCDSDDEADRHGILANVCPIEMPAADDPLGSTLLGGGATLQYPPQPPPAQLQGSAAANDPPSNASRDSTHDERQQPTLKPLPPIVATTKHNAAFRDVLVHFVNPATATVVPSTPTAAAAAANTGGCTSAPAEEHPKRSSSGSATAASASSALAAPGSVSSAYDPHTALPETPAALSAVSPPPPSPALLLPGTHHVLVGSVSGTAAQVPAAGAIIRPPSPTSQRRSSESIALDSATQTDFGAGVSSQQQQHTHLPTHTSLTSWIPPTPATLPKFRIPHDSDEFFFSNNGAPVFADDRDPEFVAAVSRRNPNLEGVIPPNEFRKLLVAGEWMPPPPLLQSVGRGEEAQVVVALHQRHAGNTNGRAGVLTAQPYHSFEEQFPAPPPSTMASKKQKATCGCW